MNTFSNIESIEFLNYSNIEFFILDSVKIEFGGLVDFCVLYERNNIGSEDLKSIKYNRNNSSLGVEYLDSNLGINIKKAIQTLDVKDKGHLRFVKQEQETFGKNILINKKVFNIIQDNSLSFYYFNNNYTNKSDSGIIKEYTFNAFITVFLNGFNYFLTIGINQKDKTLKGKELEFRVFFKKIDALIKRSVKKHKTNSDRDKLVNQEINNPYRETINTYKELIFENKEIQLNLFLLNPFDLRLYYSYYDESMIDENSINEYIQEIETCNDLGITLDLSENQKKYIKNNLRKKIIEDSGVLIDEIEILIDNIANVNYIKHFFDKENEEDLNFNKWLFLIFITSIPQEPWTGIAGYSADTKQFEISSTSESDDKEERWNPQTINPSYFYSKLMKYEQVLGVGNQGLMASFPLMDSGQVKGVLFATKSSSKNKFTKKELYKLQYTSEALKQIITIKNKNDFIVNYLSSLSKDPDYIQNPTYLILKFLPYLFNPLLSIAWENNRNTNTPTIPSHVFGYITNDRGNQKRDKGLIPLRYRKIETESKKLKLYSNDEEDYFQIIKDYRNEHGMIIGEFETKKSLPGPFKNYYNDINRNRAKEENAFKRIHSSIIFYARIESDKELYIQIFLQEQKPFIESNIGTIKEKFSIIGNLLNQTKFLKSTLDSKLIGIHEIKQNYITPSKQMLEEVEDVLETINIAGYDINKKNEIASYINSTTININSLLDRLTYLDPTMISNKKSKKELSIINVAKKSWDNLIYLLKYETKYNTGEDEIFRFYKSCIQKASFIIKTNDFNKNVNDIEYRSYREKYLTEYNEDDFISLFMSLFKNAFSLSVIKNSKHNKKYKVELEIIEDEDNYKIIFKNWGAQIENKKLTIINEMFAKIKESNDNNTSISSKFLLKYTTFINDKKTNRDTSGIGLIKVVKDLYTNNDSNENLIRIESDNICTRVVLLFKKHI